MIDYLTKLSKSTKCKYRYGRQYNSRTDLLLRTFKNHVADLYLNKVKGDGITLQVLADRYGTTGSTISLWKRERLLNK